MHSNFPYLLYLSPLLAGLSELVWEQPQSEMSQYLADPFAHMPIMHPNCPIFLPLVLAKMDAGEADLRVVRAHYGFEPQLCYLPLRPLPHQPTYHPSSLSVDSEKL